jgi:urate oxidase
VLADVPAVSEIRLEANNRTWDQVKDDVFTDPPGAYGVLGLTLRRS